MISTEILDIKYTLGYFAEHVLAMQLINYILFLTVQYLKINKVKEI